MINLTTPAYRPAWHPVGDRLAFNNKGKCNHYLWQIGIDGSGQAQLTPEVPLPRDAILADHGACWDKSGRHVRFHSNRSGAWRIYSVSVDERRIIPCEIPGFDSVGHAAWSADEKWMSFDAS